MLLIALSSALPWCRGRQPPRRSGTTDMAGLIVPYLKIATNGDGTKRHGFEPRQDARPQGWASVRLHDKYERPIHDPLEAAARLDDQP